MRDRVLGSILTLCVLLIPLGCLDVETPTEKPGTKVIKGFSSNQVEAVQRAIEEKDLNLPSKVRRLADYLDKLRMNITVGEGSAYNNAAQAAADIDRVVARLQDWHHRSLTRTEEGDTDADRRELQAILDDAKAVLAEVKVRGG